MQFQHNCVNYNAIFALKCKFVEIWCTKVGTKYTCLLWYTLFITKKMSKNLFIIATTSKKMIIYARYFEKGVSPRSCLDLDIFIQFLSSLK